MWIAATFKGRLLVTELWNRLKHSKIKTKMLFLSHRSVVTLWTSTVVKNRTNAVFSLLQLCRGVWPGSWHCTAAVATQMTASMANALTWYALCCNSTSSVPQEPRELHWFNYHFPLFMHRQWVSLFLPFLAGHVVQQIHMTEKWHRVVSIGWPESGSANLGRMTACAKKKRQSGGVVVLMVHLALLSVVMSCLTSNFSSVQLKPWSYTSTVQWSYSCSVPLPWHGELLWR